MNKCLNFSILLICSIFSIYPTASNESRYTHKAKVSNKTVEAEEVTPKANNIKNKKQPTVIKSWQKLISLKWNKLSGDDAWNIIGSTVGVIGIYAIIKNLSNGNNQPQPAYNMNQATPQQQQINQARQALYNQLNQPYQIPSFEQYKQPYMQQYQKNIAQIQEQFAGVGGARSSAFGNQLASATGNVETQLRVQYERECQRIHAMNLERLRMLAQHFPNGL